jgi:hypothetical protein
MLRRWHKTRESPFHRRLLGLIDLVILADAHGAACRVWVLAQHLRTAGLLHQARRLRGRSSAVAAAGRPTDRGANGSLVASRAQSDAAVSVGSGGAQARKSSE